MKETTLSPIYWSLIDHPHGSDFENADAKLGRKTLGGIGLTFKRDIELAGLITASLAWTR
jgi:hypothetical protein